GFRAVEPSVDGDRADLNEEFRGPRIRGILQDGRVVLPVLDPDLIVGSRGGKRRIERIEGRGPRRAAAPGEAPASTYQTEALLSGARAPMNPTARIALSCAGNRVRTQNMRASFQN